MPIAGPLPGGVFHRRFDPDPPDLGPEEEAAVSAADVREVDHALRVTLRGALDAADVVALERVETKQEHPHGHRQARVR